MTPEQRERKKQYMRTWVANNRDSVREKHRAWAAANPDRVRDYASRRDPVKTRETQAKRYAKQAPAIREQGLLARYGIDSVVWEMLFERQGRSCGVCRRTDAGTRKGWHVDHDHATGFVRGILCQTCNIGLGHFHDSPDKLRAAIAYLEPKS